MRSLVVGVGNLLCTDDGVGIHVIERLNALHRGVETVDAAMGSIEIIEAMRGYDRAIIVDAIQTGAKSGTIHRVNLAAGEKPPTLTHSHGTDILTTIQLGYRLYAGEMPREITLIAVEAEDTTTISDKLSPVVEKAVAEVIDIVLGLVGVA
jgi:hydrogenase maturation protease